MKSTLQKLGSSLRIGMAICASGFLLSTAGAATLLQDFGTAGATPEAMPTGWQVKYRNNTTNANNLSTAGIIGTIPGTTDKGLLLQRTTGTSDSSVFVSYTGTTDGIAAGKVADFTAEVTLRLSPDLGNSSAVGMAVRANSTDYTYTGYFIGISNTGGVKTLDIFKNPTSNAAHGTSLDSAAFSFTSSTDYVLKISAVGSIISASVWSVGGDSALASVSINNADVLSAGYFGLRSGYGNNNQSAAFTDFSLTAIPEPGSVTLLLSAALLTLAASRARKPRNS